MAGDPPAEAPPPAGQWRDFLRRYMAHVYSVEGSCFTPTTSQGFTEQEVEVLEEMERQVWKDAKE